MRPLLVLIVVACGGSKPSPSVPPEVDTWARGILAMPVSDACEAARFADYFCFVKPALETGAVRGLGAHLISIQNVHSNGRYIDLDWGGGHVDAYGVYVGPVGWSPGDPDSPHHKLRDGVFTYDSRP